VIGAGGVGSVAVHKMAMNPDIFSDIALASRTLSKCDAIAKSVKARTGVTIQTAQIDADDVAAPPRSSRASGRSSSSTSRCPIRISPSWTPALPPACIIWTPPITSRATRHSSNIAGSGPIRTASRNAGLMALLGSGFDPGVTSVFAMWLKKHKLETDPHARHPRLQWRRSRPAFRHQLQPGNQHPRSDRARAPLGKRRMGRNPRPLPQAELRFRGGRPQEHVPDVS
jgi:hypothetical protein